MPLRETPPRETPAGPGLLERVRAGDGDAFEHLMRLHERRVFGVAWRLLGRTEDAQDAAQEVFLRLYRHAGGIDPARPLEAWLYRVTVNVCRDLGRRRQQRAAGEVALDEAPEAAFAAGRASDPAAVAEARAEQRRVERDLRRLGEKERTALILRDLEGLSTAEVAHVLGSSEVTVRTHVCRARLKMKKLRESRQGER